MKTLIFIGGFYHLGFFAFHLFFWKIFNWKEDLRKLNPINRGIIQILNLRLMWVFLVVAFISFFYMDELLTSGLGKALIISIAVFWLMRAVEQMIFFGLRNTLSAAFFVVFLFGVGVYSYMALV